MGAFATWEIIVVGIIIILIGWALIGVLRKFFSR